MDWFGAVERNYSIPSEPSIQVIISPLAPDHGDLASSKSVIDSQRKTIKVGIGQLPVVRIGSLWKNGELLADQAGKVEFFNGLQISPQTVRLIRSNHRVGDEWLIPPSYHLVGGDGLKAHCLAVEHKGDPFGIIIPSVEVIRFYYAHSTDLAHAIFAGDEATVALVENGSSSPPAKTGTAASHSSETDSKDCIGLIMLALLAEPEEREKRFYIFLLYSRTMPLHRLSDSS